MSGLQRRVGFQEREGETVGWPEKEQEDGCEPKRNENVVGSHHLTKKPRASMRRWGAT